MDLGKFTEQLISYVSSHWGSEELPSEWRKYDYRQIFPRVFTDFTKEATKGRQHVRLAGQSGSGKTSQLLPAAEAMFATKSAHPVLVAARCFAPYHPHYQDILDRFGPEQVREHTNEFAVVMMFLTFKALVEQGYDIILDVTLLDRFVEQAIMIMLSHHDYSARILMVAVSKDISDQFIQKRKSRVVKNTTAEEFWRATHESLDFYVATHPQLHTTVWSAWDLEPVYDGPIEDALPIIKKYQSISELPEDAPSEDQLRAAKIKTLAT